MDKEQRKNDGFIVVDRKIPTTWLVSIFLTVMGWGVTTYYNTQRNIESLQKSMDVMTSAVSRLSDKMSDKDLTEAKSDMKLQEIYRRIDRLEKEKEK